MYINILFDILILLIPQYIMWNIMCNYVSNYLDFALQVIFEPYLGRVHGEKVGHGRVLQQSNIITTKQYHTVMITIFPQNKHF